MRRIGDATNQYMLATSPAAAAVTQLVNPAPRNQWASVLGTGPRGAAAPSTMTSVMRPRDFTAQTQVTGASETALLITAAVVGIGAAAIIGHYASKKLHRRAA